MDAHRINEFEPISPESLLDAAFPSRPVTSEKLPTNTTNTNWTLGPLPTDPGELRTALNIEKLWESAVEKYHTGCKELGVTGELKNTILPMALYEAIKNSLIHGVLGLKESPALEHLVGQNTPEEIRKEALEKIKRPSEVSKISIQMDLTPERVVFTILDGGDMTEEMFTRKWKVAAELEISSEETSGMGFSMLLLAFTSGRGIAGGVILEKKFQPVSPQ